MQVTGGQTNVSTYFLIRTVADGKAATGLTITTFDLQYVREGEAPVSKVDATALAAADSTHSPNKMFEVDAASSPGLYRVDWPDAAFADDVDAVFLSVTYDATVFAETQKVEIDPPPTDITEAIKAITDQITFTVPNQVDANVVSISTAGSSPSSVSSLEDSFCTIIEAQVFLNGYLNTAAWDSANTTQREKALQEATTRINNLNFKDNYPDTSDVFKEACSLIAARLLDDIDMEAEGDSLGIKSQGISSARMIREGTPPHTVAGIPSQLAWFLLLPYLEGLTTVRLDRVS